MDAPSASPEVLGRLLVIPSMLEVLPDTGAIALFLNEAMREVPGISGLTLCVEGVLYPPQQETLPVKGSSCDRLEAGNQSQFYPNCLCREEADTLIRQAILLATPRHQYGHLILEISDSPQFELYQPYICNIANIVATVIENRAFMHDLQATNSRLTEVLNHLEQRVEERTRILSEEIARRETLEADLRTSEEKYRSLLEATSEGFWLLDTEWKLVEVNQALCTMLGYSETELIGKFPFDLAADDKSHDVLVQNFLQIPCTQHRHYEVVLKTKAGGKVHTSVHATTLKRSPGDVQGAFAFLTDITEKAQLEAERKRAEEKLQLAASVFTHAREGIFITNAEGTILDVNEAFTHITGYSHSEAVGQNPRILKSGRQTPEFYAAMWQTMQEQGYWCGEIWNRRKNGEVFAEMLTLSAVRNDQGRPQYYVALFSNITAQKEQQEQLERIAHYDVLTSLPNRLLLSDRLHQAMAQVERLGQRLAVVYLDLDGFKAVNDTYGHEAGDQLLMTVAKRMKHALREDDTIARLGGDEFVAVLLNCADIESSRASFDRLLAAASQPVHLENRVLQVSVSLGVTFYPPNRSCGSRPASAPGRSGHVQRQVGRQKPLLYLQDVSPPLPHS